MKSLDFYFGHYRRAHRHPANIACHKIGIPTIIVALILLIATPYKLWGWGLFALGWVFQFVGHAIERSRPEFLQNPIYLLIGPLYLIHNLKEKFKSRQRNK